jgi:hypothetical protein
VVSRITRFEGYLTVRDTLSIQSFNDAGDKFRAGARMHTPLDYHDAARSSVSENHIGLDEEKLYDILTLQDTLC